jgi:1-acyl-sn-glycerol-3-phosphate acyltransferase
LAWPAGRWICLYAPLFAQLFIRHPERRGKDVETTRRSCEKFRAHPTTIVNFVEGSRFTEEKTQTRSPYQNLLPPKAAGIAMALTCSARSSINF